uniref:Microcephalin n=1 Tax=Anolis carolinensis TaxID=28377 RepID=G1KVY5_ANOCA|nr:PREDICTED: microcephalin isoform X2 [Anolis carolinensis]|eukprot:XP_008116247.1 PREDICTED: microcephalin isoform X2 [Anolis carolinensis]
MGSRLHGIEHKRLGLNWCQYFGLKMVDIIDSRKIEGNSGLPACNNNKGKDKPDIERNICRETGSHVDESLYPAKNSNEGLPLFIKKHKCMQPKDFTEKSPQNDRKLQKRLEIMAKELAVQKATIEIDTPVLVFEDNGSLAYSPASKIRNQCSAMEKRIKDMKEKRENLSLTASQMSQVSNPSSVPTLQEQSPFSTSATCELLSGESNHILSPGLADVLENIDTKGPVKESSELICEVDSTADISTAALWNSPLSADDFKHTSRKQPNGKHLKRELILRNSLEDEWLVEKASCEMTSTQKHSGRNDCVRMLIGNHLSQPNNLDYSVSLERTTHSKDTEETSRNNLNSEINVPSTNPVLSPIVTGCSSKEQKKSRRRSSLRRSTTALSKKDSCNDFLQALLSPVQANKDQDTSFEDYFSPSNFNKTKVRLSLPFSCLQKSQSPDETVCKNSSSKSEPEEIFKKHSKISAIHSRKRKRMTEMNECVSSTDCVLPIMPQNKEYSTLNYMSENEKGDTSETDSLLNLSIQGKKSVNRCFPQTGDDKVSNFKNDSCELWHDLMSEKVKNTVKITKPLRTLVMTSMSSEKQIVLIQVVKKLGSFLFSDEVCKNTSHVIVGSPRRTLNVLMGIAQGCWIVSYEWVLWSLEYGYWISEEPYELSVDFPAAPICRFQRYLPNRKDHQKLFSDQPIMFISSTSQPPCKKLCKLVELCGGKVCKTIRDAKICIGKCKIGQHNDIHCLSEKWILDSITQHKICPLENYIFHNKF